MRTTTIRTGLVVFTSYLAAGQTFDAASVKLATPVMNGPGMAGKMGPSGGPGTKDPGRIRYPNMSLKLLLMNAYGVKPFQIAGPVWLDTERFDIDATMPPETTREQFRVMLQNLLADRFKLTIHRETKELQMYALVVGKNGPKMKESAEAPAATNDDSPAPPPAPFPSQPTMGADGFPVLPPRPGGRGGASSIRMPGRARMIDQQQTMQDLAGQLTSQLGRPVTDATALKAKYDFTLTFSLDGINGPMGLIPPPQPGGGGSPASMPEVETLPDIFAAVQAQLGLKLEPKKGPVEMIVIDHIEKTPTEN